MPQRPPSRVRAFLRQELALWRAEGLVDERAAEALTRRYGLEEPEGSGLAVGALYVLAACLVGAGVISLVAWHWEEMPRGLRLGLLGGAVVGAHAAGYWMWKVTGRQPRLGHAVSFLGTLLFGAAIGLVAQIFHVSGVWYGFFGGWALGAFAAGVALPSLPALAFALVLGEYVWAPGYVLAHPARGELVAWGLGGLGVALAFVFRSRALFLLAYVGLGVALAFAIGAPDHGDAVSALLAALYAMVAAATALALQRQGEEPHPFAGVAGWLGRLAFYVPTFALSFHWVVRDLHGSTVHWSRAWITCALPLALAAAALLALGLAQAAAWPAKLVAGVTAGYALLFTLVFQVLQDALLITVLANAALLAVAGARMAQGLRERLRGPFWEGLAVAALVAASRFFEIESMLWLKGVGFIGCGVAVIVAGMAFERRLKAVRAEVPHA
jgi:uncharacterized membrane protein